MKNASAPVRVTRTRPVPVSVPVPPLITAAATGAKIALAPLTFRVPLTAKLLLSVSGCVTLESVRLKKVIELVLVMLCAMLPLKLNKLVSPVKVPVPNWKLPPTFVVLLLPLKLPVPSKVKLVGETALPVLLVQLPLVVTLTSPPMVVFRPETNIAPDVEMLLPGTVQPQEVPVAVLPENVMLALVPFNNVDKPPAT